MTHNPVVLPIDPQLAAICDAVRAHPITAVVAPPGAGKTTRVPPALLDAGIADKGAIIILQPRRIAARLTAKRMAAERNDVVGGVVGYAIRHERKITKRTKIKVLTEGMLTRMVQNDPFLQGVQCVILDEFHERSLHADLAFALVHDLQQQARPDLKIILMSATLDIHRLRTKLVDVPVIEVPGRSYPIEAFWRPPHGRRLQQHVGDVVAEFAPIAPKRDDGVAGDILVFLPGRREIRWCAQALSSSRLEVLELHGGLSSRQQDAVLRRSDKQRVILSTNVAETSLTLADVTTVLDSGLVRRPTNSGQRLRTISTSQASATQRAGRAGRTRPGTAVRLWSKHDEVRRPSHDEPALMREELTSLYLEVLAWGASVDDLLWFDPPPEPSLSAAKDLLTKLGAMDTQGLTAMGHALNELPLHPRLGAVLLAGRREGLGHLASMASAVLMDRLTRSRVSTPSDSDLDHAMECVQARLDGASLASLTRRYDLPAAAIESACKSVRSLHTGPREPSDRGALGRLLLAGFPDRVALKRGDGEHFKLADGRGARLSPNSRVRQSNCVIALELGASDRSADPDIFVACTIDPLKLPTKESREVNFDESRKSVSARLERHFGALVLSSQPTKPSADEAHCALVEATRGRALTALEMDPAAMNFLDRLRWLARQAPELGLPTFDELSDEPQPNKSNDQTDLISQWCLGLRSWEQLRRLNHLQLLTEQLSWKHAQALQQHAPDKLSLPCGRRANMRYESDGRATASAKIQHFFGLTESPRLAMGRVTVRCELLAPNGRPAQVTSDLAGFWRNTWLAVRADLRGRYPKHPWPERPNLDDARRGRRRKKTI